MRCQNVGGIDRVLRVTVGAGLVVLGIGWLIAGQARGWVAVGVGVPPLATGALGFCPPYLLFGFSTARRDAPGSG